MKKLHSLTVFFPAFNDAKILPYLIMKVNDIVPRLASHFEVMVIDDGSTDETPFVTNLLSKQYPHFKVIRHLKNRGYGAALISGFTHATKEWVFYTDGDGQYNPHELKKLVEKVEPHIDVVNGYKKVRRDPFIRKIVGKLYNSVLHLLYDLPVSDVDCDFRLIRRSMLKKIQFSASSGLICLELMMELKKAGARFIEVGVNHYPRPFGRSEFFRPAHLFKTLIENMVFFYSSRINKREK